MSRETPAPMDRQTIARSIAALAAQDPVLFHAIWEATAQYIDNQDVEDEDCAPDVVQRVDAVETAMFAFDEVVAASLAAARARDPAGEL